METFDPYTQDLAVWLNAHGSKVLTLALARRLGQRLSVCWYTAPHDGRHVVGMMADLIRAVKRYPVHDDDGNLMLFTSALAAREFLKKEFRVECPIEFYS